MELNQMATLMFKGLNTCICHDEKNLHDDRKQILSTSLNHSDPAPTTHATYN
jgi:hypothetical protein